MANGLDRLGAVSDKINEDVNNGNLGASADSTEQVSENTSEENTTTTETTTEVAASSAPNKSKAEELFDLGKAQKIKFEGKEWTPAELKAAILRQSDYTKKTQEISKDREYIDNLDSDLDALEQDPSLIGRFKEIYPEKYHRYADRAVKGLEQSTTQTQAPGTQGIDPQVKAELQKIRADNARLLKDVEERELNAINTKLDAMASNMAKKHGMEKDEADLVEERVLSKAHNWLDQNPKAKITDEKWNELWDQETKRFQKLQDDSYARKIKKQKDATESGRDIGAGGGAPGSSPKRETLSQATDRAIRELSSR